jgi:methylphosphotriester-DNA--protein-cysteine methyltransferase
MSRSPKDEPVAFDFDFDEAMHRVAQTNPQEVTQLVRNAGEVDSIDALIDRFEAAGHDNGRGDKCWFARDLQVLLGYAKWDKFESVIERASEACQNAGHPGDDHFAEVFPQTGKNPLGGRPGRDFELSRYACYLIAQNASSRLKPVAFAQTYFAIQTRRQEIADRDGVDFSALSSTHQRLYLRNQIVEENKKLAGTAKRAGVEDKYYGKFQNRGYQGLYGGRGADEIRAFKGLPANAKILDHMDSTELAANLFRITQTDEKLRNENIRGREAACDAHFEVGSKVRATMKELSGVHPEHLPVAEDVRKIAAQERKQQRMRAIPAQTRIEQPLAAPKATDPIEINLTKDLWKYALLIMSANLDSSITTSELIDRIPDFISISDQNRSENPSRKDSKISQIVRNLKSHKASKSNFIYQGYANDVPGGFRITQKGLDFVREYFKDRS